MNKMIQLTTNSWLIKSTIENSGLLFKKENNYLFLNKTKRIELASIEEFNSKWKNPELDVLDDQTILISKINGFPVKHDNITIVSESPALYCKVNSNLIFAAGYWGIMFANGWTLVLCPKQKTTMENEIAGPYKNRLEALNQLASLNNKRNLQKDM